MVVFVVNVVGRVGFGCSRVVGLCWDLLVCYSLWVACGCCFGCCSGLACIRLFSLLVMVFLVHWLVCCFWLSV